MEEGLCLLFVNVTLPDTVQIWKFLPVDLPNSSSTSIQLRFPDYETRFLYAIVRKVWS